MVDHLACKPVHRAEDDVEIAVRHERAQSVDVRRAEPVELDADAQRQALVTRRGQHIDVGVEIGVRRLVPERMRRDAGRLPEPVAVLGQRELRDSPGASGSGIPGDVLWRHPARPETLAVGGEMAVVVDQHR